MFFNFFVLEKRNMLLKTVAKQTLIIKCFFFKIILENSYQTDPNCQMCFLVFLFYFREQKTILKNIYQTSPLKKEYYFMWRKLFFIFIIYFVIVKDVLFIYFGETDYHFLKS